MSNPTVDPGAMAIVSPGRTRRSCPVLDLPSSARRGPTQKTTAGAMEKIWTTRFASIFSEKHRNSMRTSFSQSFFFGFLSRSTPSYPFSWDFPSSTKQLLGYPHGESLILDRDSLNASKWQCLMPNLWMVDGVFQSFYYILLMFNLSWCGRSIWNNQYPLVN
jgi:hypothetical protein